MSSSKKIILSLVFGLPPLTMVAQAEMPLEFKRDPYDYYYSQFLSSPSAPGEADLKDIDKMTCTAFYRKLGIGSIYRDNTPYQAYVLNFQYRCMEIEKGAPAREIPGVPAYDIYRGPILPPKHVPEVPAQHIPAQPDTCAKSLVFQLDSPADAQKKNDELKIIFGNASSSQDFKIFRYLDFVSYPPSNRLIGEIKFRRDLRGNIFLKADYKHHLTNDYQNSDSFTGYCQ